MLTMSCKSTAKVRTFFYPHNTSTIFFENIFLKKVYALSQRVISHTNIGIQRHEGTSLCDVAWDCVAVNAILLNTW